eukprot:3940288-Rhodomonas_salina.1
MPGSSADEAVSMTVQEGFVWACRGHRGCQDGGYRITTERKNERFPKAEGEILVLVLSNGMQFSELAAVIDGLKNSSKSMGSHARREKYWQAYTKMNSKVAGMDGQAYCMLMYRAKEDGEGECSLMELTKRQKGLVNGACEFMGQKVKPPEDPSSKNWCLVFSEEDAPRSATLSVNILVLVLTHALVVPGHGAT